MYNSLLQQSTRSHLATLSICNSPRETNDAALQTAHPARASHAAAGIAGQGGAGNRAQFHAGHALSRALHLPGVYLALPDDGAAGLRPSRHRLCPPQPAGGEQVAEALSRLLPQPRRLPRGLHHRHCPAPGEGAEAGVAAHRRLLVPARRHPHRRLLPDRAGTQRPVAPRPGRRPVPRPGMKKGTVPFSKDAIRDKARELGFDAVGFTSPDIGDAGERLGEFLDAGMHGDMGWLATKRERRADPRALWPEVQTIIVLGVNYGPDGDLLELLKRRERGTISVYAWGRDYHDVVKSR